MQVRKANDKADDRADVAFRATIWKRDDGKCRCCGKAVKKSLELIPDRGEVNHLHGRHGALRFEARAALLMCAECHAEFTGKVGGVKLFAKPTKTFKLETKQGWQKFTDARAPILWERTPPRKAA